MGIRQKFIYASTALTFGYIAWRRQQTDSLPPGFVIGLFLLNIVSIWCFHAYIYPHYFSALRDIPIIPVGIYPACVHLPR